MSFSAPSRHWPPHPRRGGWAGRLHLLGPVLAAGGCCLAPPSQDELAARGYLSPSQTVRTFQVGVRADHPRTEYGCFSTGFRARNRLSRVNYVLFRREWFAADPWIRKGVAEARIVAEREVSPRERELTLEKSGYRFVVTLVREDFEQLYAGEELIHDEKIRDFRDQVASDRGGQLLVGEIELPENVAASDVTRLVIGQDWKIDELRRLEERPDP